MARIFISHSASDHEAASALCAALESRGLQCWVAPRDIPAGEQYATAIMQAIQSTDAMVVMFSEHSNTSQHVHREVERAVNYRKRIYPVAIDGSPSTGALDYLLATLQWDRCLAVCSTGNDRKCRGTTGQGAAGGARTGNTCTSDTATGPAASRTDSGSSGAPG